MRYIVLTTLLIGISASRAQHCVWDLTSIVIVDVREAETRETINGLDIQVTDFKGNSYVRESYGENETNTLIFTQNPDKIIQKRPNFIEFPLCNDCYVLFVFGYSAEMREKFITIKDTNVKRKQHFETRVVKIKPENIQNLCRGGNIWNSRDLVEKVKIRVRLKKKTLP
ncbi:hypothetical protein [uncultured Aquimarina sp.]|uniref:hypothetical protein n=1 Tax=uncultured Aquimarina sp. TaxID=575652 RepID=UPI00263837CA|nr:hypothetical protein [uncultured Aquimarina sp.]